MNRSLLPYALIILLIVLAGYSYVQRNHIKIPSSSLPGITENTAPQISPRSKETGCLIRGALQDIACTPGAIYTTATKSQICVSGYSGTVRNVPSTVKSQVYKQYGILTHAAGEYEVDHLISLELGGSNDIANLWPEAANPIPGFHEKDAAENYLHSQVCNGTITLAQAQTEIATNWLMVYQQMQK